LYQDQVETLTIYIKLEYSNMYASNPPGNWQHFTKRQDNVGLSLMEVRSKYLKEQLMYEEFISHTIQQQRLQAQQHSAGGKQKAPAYTRTSNGIEFTVNTAFGTYFAFAFGTSATTGYVLDWGNGTVITVPAEEAYSGGAEIDYTYPEPGIYNCRLTFDDVSVVTSLDFPGDD